METKEMAQHLVDEYGKLALGIDKAKEVALKHVEIHVDYLKSFTYNNHMEIYWWQSVIKDINRL